MSTGITARRIFPNADRTQRRERGIQLPVSVAIGTDLQRVIDELERVARDHPLVAREAPPKAIVVRLGPDSLGLELQARTEHAEQWLEIRSDLAAAPQRRWKRTGSRFDEPGHPARHDV